MCEQMREKNTLHIINSIYFLVARQSIGIWGSDYGDAYMLTTNRCLMRDANGMRDERDTKLSIVLIISNLFLVPSHLLCLIEHMHILIITTIFDLYKTFVCF